MEEEIKTGLYCMPLIARTTSSPDTVSHLSYIQIRESARERCTVLGYVPIHNACLSAAGPLYMYRELLSRGWYNTKSKIVRD